MGYFNFSYSPHLPSFVITNSSTLDYSLRLFFHADFATKKPLGIELEALEQRVSLPQDSFL